ncbi:kinase-like protein, partial [Auriscalpium vulgare]
HYTEDIQTRQYRSPEAIIGRSDWGCKVDIWSVACVVFELLTAEYLFEPQAHGQVFSKDDDHMAQIIELLGDIPARAKAGGRYSRELFDHTGALRYIRHLKPWPLARVMREKYLLPAEDADALCAFLEPMLALDFEKRAGAGEMVQHEWLEVDWREQGEALQNVVW